MSGHGPIYEWQDFETDALKKALDLMAQLAKLGFECCSDDMKYSIEQEIKERERNANA